MLAEFLYYTSCLPKAGTELDLSGGLGRARVSLTREALTGGLLKREQGESGDHSLVTLTAASGQKGGMTGLHG